MADNTVLKSTKIFDFLKIRLNRLLIASSSEFL